MTSTKSFRIDDLLKNPTDSSSISKELTSSVAAISQLPVVSVAPIDYSRPRLANANQGNICINNPLSILRSNTEEKGAFQEVRQSCPGHIISNPVANNSINLQFVSTTTNPNTGPNQSQALVIEAQKLNQNRQSGWVMDHHHQVSGNPMIMTMPIHPGGSFPFPVGVMKFPSGSGHPFIEQAKFPEAICDRIHYSMYPFIRHGHGYSHCRRKGGQIRFNNSQTGQLEKAFLSQKYLTSTERRKLAQTLGLSDRQVKTWFQNRRAKFRKTGKNSRSCINKNDNDDPINKTDE